MLRNLSCVAMIAVLTACGSTGSDGSLEPCALDNSDGIDSNGARSHVDLKVVTTLPTVFTQACPAAVLADLEIFLTVPGSESCFLALENNVVQGCCPGVATDQNAYAALIYRVQPGFALGEQAKTIALPTTSEAVVELDFDSVSFDGAVYDADQDGETNIEEYCAGTLN